MERWDLNLLRLNHPFILSSCPKNTDDCQIRDLLNFIFSLLCHFIAAEPILPDKLKW